MYTYKGQQYPSVSTIIGQLDKSDALIPWALNCFEAKLNELIASGTPVSEAIVIAKRDYRNVSDTALDIGSQVHSAIEQYIKTGKDLSGELMPEVANGFIAFLQWESENVSKWIESEIKTVNTTYGYGGTLDAIFENRDGEIVIVDFKTSKAIFDEMWLQISAYRKAREETFGQYTIDFDRGETATFSYDLPKIEIEQSAILRLDKQTGMPEYVVRDSKKTTRDFTAFAHLTDFYYNQKKRRLKGNEIVKSIWE
jgi:hypothetical protein